MEGCDQIATVAKFKVWQSFASNLGFWASLILGLNLWSAVVLSSISAVLCIYYLLIINTFVDLPVRMKSTALDINHVVTITDLRGG